MIIIALLSIYFLRSIRLYIAMGVVIFSQNAYSSSSSITIHQESYPFSIFPLIGILSHFTNVQIINETNRVLDEQEAAESSSSSPSLAAVAVQKAMEVWMRGYPFL